MSEPHKVSEPMNEHDYYRALQRERDRAHVLRVALGFASSVIKCREPWTKECEKTIGDALAYSSDPNAVDLRETIRFMAENVHQAYHVDSNTGWWDCKKNVCNAAQQAIPEIATKLRGPR